MGSSDEHWEAENVLGEEAARRYALLLADSDRVRRAEAVAKLAARRAPVDVISMRGSRAPPRIEEEGETNAERRAEDYAGARAGVMQRSAR